MLRALATVGGWTGVSRVLGFLRDILLAAALGAGPVADAFVIAFRFPNLFRRLFAEGAFNAAFVPLFARRLEEEGRAAALALAEQSLAVMLAAVLPLTVLAMAAMPWLLHVMAPGFAADPEKYRLTVEMTRITFPYLLFMSLVALYSAVLNAFYRFTAAAAAPVVLNLCFIVSLTALVPFVENLGHLIAWTIAVAGALQFLLLVWAGLRAEVRLRLRRPRITANLRLLLARMGPGVVSAGALQLNILISSIIASLMPGANAYLYYAERVYQLPLGLIGIAFGVVLLPDLSRKLRSGQREAARQRLVQGLGFAALLTLPAAVALAVVPLEVVVGLFERAAFARPESLATAAALMAFAFGLPAFVATKIFQSAYFADEDTKTPLKFNLVGISVNVTVGATLFYFIGHVGLAIGTSVAAWLTMTLFLRGLARRGDLRIEGALLARLGRTLAAALAMGLLLWLLAGVLAPWRDGGEAQSLAALAILVTAGLAVYVLAAFLTGAARPAELRQLLRRGA